ncbi:MAG TPA: plastocyanin/azurin family copper-binding protein [Candidatus Dormibacteraeota bacterium]|jgi:plastocyanin|nr:plastocyanin/azurin family copper-binding protein [Candidatus Dormibacteraeota bacterium]
MNFAFSPQVIAVHAGDTVTWTNQDADAHTVTFDSDGTGSTPLDTGKTFQHIFAAPGTFTYHCSIHNSMTGEVVVT